VPRRQPLANNNSIPIELEVYGPQPDIDDVGGAGTADVAEGADVVGGTVVGDAAGGVCAEVGDATVGVGVVGAGTAVDGVGDGADGGTEEPGGGTAAEQVDAGAIPTLHRIDQKHKRPSINTHTEVLAYHGQLVPQPNTKACQRCWHCWKRSVVRRILRLAKSNRMMA